MFGSRSIRASHAQGHDAETASHAASHLKSAAKADRQGDAPTVDKCLDRVISPLWNFNQSSLFWIPLTPLLHL